MNNQTTTRPQPPVAASRYLPLLLVLFVGSGCAALIYEIVWFQALQLVIGASALSLGVLLGTFMGGMCLGSLLLPRLISPHRHPLRAYAALEMGIGACGLLLWWGLPLVERIYTVVPGGLWLRCVVAGVCLLPPTVLMGATLPAIARWVRATPAGVAWLGLFYAGNLAGAVIGCLLAGFYLLPTYDMGTATYAAVAINVVVAALGLLLSAVTPARVEEVPGSTAASPGPRPSALAPGPSSLGPRPFALAPSVYGAIALSGLTALGAEVVWTRLLSLLLGATVYTFSIILAVFLVGLGLGSSIGASLSRRAHPRIALAVCQLLLTAAIAWAGFQIASSLPYWPIDPTLAPSPWHIFQLDLLRCAWVVLPGAMLWGASFPLALAAAAGRSQDPGRLVGGVYAANTLGAIAGALGFSMIVIPALGTRAAQQIMIFLAAASALLVLLPTLLINRTANISFTPPRAFRLALAALAALGVFALAFLLSFNLPPLHWGTVAFGRMVATWNYRLAPDIVVAPDVPARNDGPDRFCLFVGEGTNVSVAVSQAPDGRRYFHGAGKVQASTDPLDMRLQRMLGHISALGIDKPESVLVVACGAGVTAGTFVTHPEVKRIVICDIEAMVPRFIAPMFKDQNHDVIHDPRTQVVIDDGRHFVRTTREKFDIITSDPVDPWVKGCAALNTVEYFTMCKEHLNPGGVMTLWVPLYGSDLPASKSLIASFFQVFPQAIIWSNDERGKGYDVVLFGQAQPTVIDVDQLQRRLDRVDHQRVRASLSEVGYHSVVDLLATYAGSGPRLRAWAADAQINTDRNLRLQYLAGLAVDQQLAPEILDSILVHYEFPRDIFHGTKELDRLENALRQAGREGLAAK